MAVGKMAKFMQALEIITDGLDGGSRIIEMVLSSKTTPIKDKKGNIVGFEFPSTVKVTSDISRLKCDNVRRWVLDAATTPMKLPSGIEVNDDDALIFLALIDPKDRDRRLLEMDSHVDGRDFFIEELEGISIQEKLGVMYQLKAALSKGAVSLMAFLKSLGTFLDSLAPKIDKMTKSVQETAKNIEKKRNKKGFFEKIIDALGL